ncbi:MAG: hypothetical protein QOD93_557 [Acetobacteraceae bacterium]|jgi:hypothetical protein|nr:hypothetical protein [Acetobacteraceae bacterium]
MCFRFCACCGSAGAEYVTEIGLLSIKRPEFPRRLHPFSEGTPAHDHLGDKQMILDKKADYVPVLKGNQGSLREDVKVFVAEQKAKTFPGPRSTRLLRLTAITTALEPRTATVIHDVERLARPQRLAPDWKRRHVESKTHHPRAPCV